MPIIGNSTHEIFLLANPKTQFYKNYTNTKRTNTISIHTKTKTRMRTYIFFLIFQREYIGPRQKKGLLKQILKRPVGSIYKTIASLRTHQSHELCCLPSYECTIVVLEVPHNHPNLRSPFYQESEIF